MNHSWKTHKVYSSGSIMEWEWEWKCLNCNHVIARPATHGTPGDTLPVRLVRQNYWGSPLPPPPMTCAEYIGYQIHES